MDLVKTGIGISKTIKNVARLREILLVFAQNGFEEFVVLTKLHTKVPGAILKRAVRETTLGESENLDTWSSIGLRLRNSFEELGPSFIKLGQLLSTREDLLPAPLIKELKQLQNNAQGVEFVTIKEALNQELPYKMDDIFETFEEVPIGTASIGLAYLATLKTKEKVVVKVQRPGIQKDITTDFEIISFLVGQLERSSDEFRYLGISRAIDDFFKSIQLELNFLIEAQNAQKFTKIINRLDEEKIFVVPKVFDTYSTDRVLVMEHLDGVPFNSLTANQVTEDLHSKMNKAVSMFIHSLLGDGFFHADLHGGNFFLMPNGQIGIIDFGLMGSLGRKSRMNLVALLYALVSNNYENLVYEFLDVAEYEEIPDHEKLTRDLRDTLSPFIGLNIQDIDATLFLQAIVKTLSSHQLYLPRDWFIIFRALMTLDGVGKSLDFDLDIFKLIDEEIQDIAAELLSKEALIEESVWIGRDMINSLRILPRHLKWMLREFSKKKYQLELRLVGVESEIRHISRVMAFIGLQLSSCTLFFSGVFLLQGRGIYDLHAIPTLIWILWSTAIAIFASSLSFLRPR